MTQWWQRAQWRSHLEAAVARINDANDSSARDEASRCRRLFDALDLCCTAVEAAKPSPGARNGDALVRLLAEGIAKPRRTWLCGSATVQCLAHHQGARGHQSAADPGCGPSLQSLAELLSGARRAIAEGNRVPEAPDAGGSSRYTETASITAQLLTNVFEALFDFPARRLAVYGTLAPGERHHDLVSGIPGSWSEGTVDGVVKTVAGYPAFTWVKGGRTIDVRVFASDRLPKHWGRIDQFEGEMYRRILVPVRLLRGGSGVAHIYEGRVALAAPARL